MMRMELFLQLLRMSMWRVWRTRATLFSMRFARLCSVPRARLSMWLHSSRIWAREYFLPRQMLMHSRQEISRMVSKSFHSPRTWVASEPRTIVKMNGDPRTSCQFIILFFTSACEPPSDRARLSGRRRKCIVISVLSDAADDLGTAISSQLY